MAVNAREIPELFGSMVFGDKIMREKLPRDIYKALRRTINRATPLDIDVANAVAAAMKEWALEHGATHFTHWFQPMTGITAEKHDSFIEPADGSVIMEFTGKSLIKGEPDASSFPNGGLRATFEARGYTAWDPSSYAFIKDKTLCIPTAFCAFGGQVLDKKTPLLRSMELMNTQCLRILRLFGKNDVKNVVITVGAEQEYFLVDKKVYDERPDLRLCGRTLFGARSPKGQELDDHYFGSIKPRVKSFMEELDEELWKLGIAAKTEHNEAAPAQHELAPIFTTANLACDHNQLMMEMMKKVAARHGLVCLLHEKPFDGVNGSGKHDNWSANVNTGESLFEPGESPEDNAQFLLFLVAVIRAVDEYADLLRNAIATAGNDHRLGANEAPPAIVSIFLGDELTAILDSVETGAHYDKKERMKIDIGASVLPKIPKDNTDRNRTSPFAFTGNKFEFRMLGSSLSIAGPNICLNTIVGDTLSQFADELEKAKDFNKALVKIIKENYAAHKRVVFNGDGYSDEWKAEAARRGLPNLVTCADALPVFLAKKNVDLYVRNKIFSKEEMASRTEIKLETYIKTVKIEALMMNEMIRRDILPAVERFTGELAATARRKAAVGAKVNSYESETFEQTNALVDTLYNGVCELEKMLADAKKKKSVALEAKIYAEKIIGKMDELRAAADTLETICGREFWPYPSYEDLLFSV